MKVKFIGHSGFFVDLPEMSLLFDYYKGELPEADPEKPLFIFVSHAHEDHYTGKIFTYLDRTEDVTFFLSDDIPESSVPERARGQLFSQGAEGVLLVNFDLLLLQPSGEQILAQRELLLSADLAEAVQIHRAHIYSSSTKRFVKYQATPRISACFGKCPGRR